MIKLSDYTRKYLFPLRKDHTAQLLLDHMILFVTRPKDHRTLQYRKTVIMLE